MFGKKLSRALVASGAIVGAIAMSGFGANAAVVCSDVSWSNTTNHSMLDFAPQNVIDTGIDVPSGSVTASPYVSLDTYPGRASTPAQLNEQWTISIGGVNVTPLFTTDIPDGVVEATTAGSLGTFTSPGGRLKIIHRRLVDGVTAGTPNSVIPKNLVLTVCNETDPTTTTTPTTVPPTTVPTTTTTPTTVPPTTVPPTAPPTVLETTAVPTTITCPPCPLVDDTPVPAGCPQPGTDDTVPTTCTTTATVLPKLPETGTPASSEGLIAVAFVLMGMGVLLHMNSRRSVEVS